MTPSGPIAHHVRRFRRLLTLALGCATVLSLSCGARRIPTAATDAAVGAMRSGVAAHSSFADVTRQAGLDFVQSDCGCGQRYFVEQVASGAAVIDVNQDGYPDLYFPQPKPIGVCEGKLKGRYHQRLYMNDGHGRFTLAPNAFKGDDTDYGIGAAVGDYDNDGWPDLYVCCFGKNKLYHNNHDGTFTDGTKKAGVELGGFGTCAVFFDYDRDGYQDLYCMRYCQWSVATNIECSGPNGQLDNCSPNIYTPSTNVLFHNNGNGTFTDVTKKSGAAPENRRSLGVAAVDMDGDGWLDLFVANDLGPNYLLHNNHDGTFAEIAMQAGVAVGESGGNQANMGVAVGDYNASGRQSVLVTTFANEPYTLYRNDGSFFTNVSEEAGVAAPTRSTLGFGTGFIDSRNNGLLDLFFANGHVSPWAHLTNPSTTYKQKNMLLENDGAGHFRVAENAIPPREAVHRGAVFLDFDNDGRTDILTTATADRPELLHNTTGRSGNWLTLRLYDAKGCCTPIGAVCTAWIGKRKLVRPLIGGTSFGGESDLRVHFGLGNATRVDKLEIRWLDGNVQTMPTVASNQILTVREAKAP